MRTGNSGPNTSLHITSSPRPMGLGTGDVSRLDVRPYELRGGDGVAARAHHVEEHGRFGQVDIAVEGKKLLSCTTSYGP